jgi:bifunctional DNA-binding transcriptional regulator/antitoxin component of YhaV-PrlF toxin-antitoxin module
MTTTVTDSNQVSIPPDFAREFDIHPGTRLEWAKTGHGAILGTPQTPELELRRSADF